MYKKILKFLVLALAFAGCERKPLYLREDVALNVNLAVDFAVSWATHWRDSLKYNWDESLYGELAYSPVNKVNAIIYKGGEKMTQQIFTVGEQNKVNLNLNTPYSVLLYNATYYVDEIEEYNRLYLSTPSIYSKTKSALDDYYDTVYEPGEIFSYYLSDLYISENLNNCEEIYEDGRYTYVYNMEMDLRPVTYIYLVQFIIENDDGTNIEAKRIVNFSVSGISSKIDMFTGKRQYTKLKQIETYDIKPGQMVNGDLVFCARITTFGTVQKTNSEEITWSEPTNHLFYTALDVDTYNYGQVTGIKDVTQQFVENPYGGVITVRIKNSELKKSATQGGGFGITVNEWREHNIDFET